MVREFAKPQDAREIEARARARSSGVRMAVIVEARRYCTPARSEPGTTHTIARTPIGWACSCLGYLESTKKSGVPRLCSALQIEGWVFGSIAPLDTVERHMPLNPDPDPEPEPPAGGAALLSVEAVRARGRAALAELFDDAA